MPSDAVLEVWRDKTDCADNPEHYSKSTLEKYLPKLFEQEHFEGVGKTPSSRQKALRSLWDERGDPIAIVEAVVAALNEGVHKFSYVRACLKRVPGSDTVRPNELHAKEAGAAGDQGLPPDSPGKGSTEPAAPKTPPQFDHQPTASPQLENGYIRIANEVYTRLMGFDLLSSELRIVLAVMRQTWGWNRKEADVSLADFCELTNQQERTVSRALFALQRKNLLIKKRGGGRGVKSNWAFNKNWRSWQTLTAVSENINSDIDVRVNELNSDIHDGTTLTPETEITVTDVRVSPCKPMKVKKQLGAKDTLKDKIKTEPPIVPLPDLPPAVKLTALSLFEIWNTEGGALRKITTYMTQLSKVTELVDFFNIQQNGTGPVQRWTELVRHASQTVHEEHRGFVEPVWIAKNLIHVDDLLAGKYSRSFKGDSNGKGSGSRRGNRAGNREDFKSTGRGITPPEV